MAPTLEYLVESLQRIAFAIGGDDLYGSGIRVERIRKALRAEGVRINDARFAEALYAWDRETREDRRWHFHGSTGAKGSAGCYTHIDSRGWPVHYVGVRYVRP
jgi:DNA-binding LacI/PurR family transcriptional regulator